MRAGNARRKKTVSSDRDPTAALVPPALPEGRGRDEDLAVEHGAVKAHELVVERTRVADPDPALHVALQGRLDLDPALERHVDDAPEHPLGPARDHLVEAVLLEELLRERGHEAAEPARPVAPRDGDFPRRPGGGREQEVLRGL